MNFIHQNLERLVERFWGTHPESSVLVSVGPLPDGYTVAEKYVIVPSLRRARFLVPVGAPRAVAAAFTAHLSTVSSRSRLYGWAIALAFRAGLAERLLRDRLTVGIDARVSQREWRRHLVMSELAERLNAPRLVGIHPVRRFTPNAKPTVRLFDRQGTPQGHAKLGWSAPTRRLVRQEIAALEAVDGSVGSMAVPRPLASGRWSPHDRLDLMYVVTTALPPGLKPWRGTPETDADLLSAVAATGEVWRGTLAASPYVTGLAVRLNACKSAQPEETAALANWLAALRRHDDVLDFGRWHGDWVAWNMASTGSGGGAVWDWEYSAATVPIGFDVCHWHFQTRLAGKDGDLDNAAAELETCTDGLRALGVCESAWRLVTDLYLLEILVRATALAAEGSGWNSKLSRRLVSFARERATLSA